MRSLRALAIWRTRLVGRLAAHRAAVAIAGACALAGATLVTVSPIGAGASGAKYYGSPAGHLSAPVVSMAATPSGNGYWLAASDGSVYSYGDAHFYGSMGGHPLTQPVVGMAATISGHGYWLVARDGGIFSFGDARFYGSMGGLHLNQPIVGMSQTHSGHGYWMVASDGGIFSFGDARFYGSTGALHLVRPVVGMATTASGHGYWMVASDGGIFSFGDALFYGSTGGLAIPAPIAGMAPAGHGYWLVGADGTVYSFGQAQHNAVVPPHQPVAGVSAMSAPAGGGFWFVTLNGLVYSATPSGQFVSDPNAPGARQQAIAADLLARINVERRARGLSALSGDSTLSNLAQFWSAVMASQNRMYHQNLNALFANPTYATRYRMVRENIYNGFGGSWSESGGAHLALMNSAPHRSTILMPQLTSVGVGATCVNGHLWVAEEFGLSISYPMPPNPPTPPVQPIAAPSPSGPSC